MANCWPAADRHELALRDDAHPRHLAEAKVAEALDTPRDLRDVERDRVSARAAQVEARRDARGRAGAAPDGAESGE